VTDVSGDQRPRGGLWRHRDFRLLWAGQSVSDFGTAISGVVLPLVAVVYLQASAFEVAALAAIEWVPWLLIGLPAGVWVDRSRRRPLMLWCDLVRTLAIGSIPLAAAFDALHLPQLYVAAAATGLSTVIFQVAYQAYLPTLIRTDELAEGNAKLQGSQTVAQVGGAGLGGLLVQLFRAPFALIADAASYVVSAAALFAIREREPAHEPVERNLRREIAEGARYVRADPLLRVMTIAPAIANFFFTGFSGIVVLFLVRSVHLAPASVGVLMGAVSLGAVAGALLARPVGRWIGTSRAVWLGTLLTTPFGLLIPLTTRGAGLTFFVVGNIVIYIGILIYNVTISAFRQAYCPPHLLGRVVASMRFVLFGALPLGALTGGALASWLGIREAVWVLLAGNVFSGVVLAISPLRHLRDLPAGQTERRALSPAAR
jgi:predicted MFS family arabinose efflux permease